MTGGSSGIGRAIVERFLQEGATVEFCGRARERGQALAQSLPDRSKVAFTECDVASEQDVCAWVDAAIARRGRIDVVVNNAGIGPSGPFEDVTLADWEELLRINVTGMFLVCRATIPHLRSGVEPSIINISSICAHVAMHNLVAYGVTKAAALSLTKGLALELAGDGIRVNALCPGTTSTPATESFIATGEDPAALRQVLADAHPLGRIATAEDQAAATVFLASSDAAFVTGHGLLVDGGYVAQ